MSEKKRWNVAQSYEKDWWESRADEIDFEFYKNYALDLIEFTSSHFTISSETTILEVGSGAGGIITFLHASNNRYAIDPLEGFYSNIENFVNQRDSGVNYKTGIGEDLPFENNFFDLIIMDNVLDHCSDPVKVMEEVKRVAKTGAFIYFKQNTYHLWGKIVRSAMEFLTIDKGHPFTFTKSEIISLFEKNGFEILKNTNLGYIKSWKREFFSNSAKDKIKAFLFVTRNKRIYLLKNR